MKSECNFRNYLSGAVLAFGTVLLTSQVVAIAYGGFWQTDIDFAALVGGFLGGYLVARVLRKDYIQTGTIDGKVFLIKR